MDSKKRIISVVLIATIIIPLLFYKPQKIFAQNNFGLNGEQFVDWFLTSVGGAMVENGSMVGLDPDVFYGMLYNTPLTVENYPMSASGTYTFTPSEEFSSKNEWIQVCNGSWDPSGPASTFWQSFDLADCFIDSGFIEENENGVKIKEVPALSDTTDLAGPLDGVEVITNFGSFNPNFSNLKYPYLAKQMIDDTKQSFNGYNYICVYAPTENNTIYSCIFVAYNTDINYVYILKQQPNETNTNLSYIVRYNNGWKSVGNYNPSTKLFFGTQNSTYENYYANTSQNAPFISGTIKFTDSHVQNNGLNGYYQRLENNSIQYYSNQPVVIASTNLAGENYYYWKNQIPSGILYTSNNINQTYNYNTLNNTNWSSTYQNYITDISNTYSTTENITNQQITQYIDDSTTITNITNNYIVNGSGGSGEGGSGEGGSGEGGSGQDDLLTNSWLERIYNKNVQILKAIIGDTNDPDQDITYYTDNSIKNEIIRYPASDLFPDVPIDKFLDSTADFTVDAFASALSSVLTQAIPFCYIIALFEVANVMSAQPKAPKWDIPFKIQRIGIDETVTIDMTDNAWEVVHNIWTVLIMILLVSLLFYLSYKILHLAAVIFG